MTRRVLRIGVMSDLNLEAEDEYWDAIDRLEGRDERPELFDVLERRHALCEEWYHPGRGPDLRGLKYGGIDLLLLPGDIARGTDGIDYADMAAASGVAFCGRCMASGFRGRRATEASMARQAQVAVDWTDRRETASPTF